jgi:hypothetical protein
MFMAASFQDLKNEVFDQGLKKFGPDSKYKRSGALTINLFATVIDTIFW